MAPIFFSFLSETLPSNRNKNNENEKRERESERKKKRGNNKKKISHYRKYLQGMIA
jgi:hypothetical protein